MHQFTVARTRSLWLAGLVVISCGGRAVDSGESAGGNSGSGGSAGVSTAGSGAGGNTAGADPGGTSGSSGSTVGSGGSTVGSGGSTVGSGSTTIGAGGATVGVGGTGGEGGWTGGVGGSGGTTVGSGGTTVGVGGNSSGGVGGWTGGVGGSGGSIGGSGGATGGASGSSGSSGCSTGGSGGVVQAPSGHGGSGSRGGEHVGSSGAPVSMDAATPFYESGAPPSYEAGTSDAGACFCTRRPGPGVSIRCPAGIDETIWAVIGPTGGTITLAGRQGLASGVASALTVPPKAIEKEVAVSITETSIPPPKEFFDWSPIYEISPGCVHTTAMMKLRLPWGNRDGLVPSGLTIYFAKDRNSPFKPLTDVYGNAGFTDAGITEFGLFFVGVPKPPELASCP